MTYLSDCGDDRCLVGEKELTIHWTLRRRYLLPRSPLQVMLLSMATPLSLIDIQMLSSRTSRNVLPDRYRVR
jgi:hypothetical protein